LNRRLRRWQRAPARLILRWHGKAIPEEISPDNRLATYRRNLAGASRRRRMSVRYGYGAAQAICRNTLC
jgi:hypothetical protein